MLVKLKALSVSMAGDKLYFGISKPLRGQEREHLMPQQVRMNTPVDTGQVCILANDLLHPPGREWLIQPRLKQEVVAGMCLNVGL